MVLLHGFRNLALMHQDCGNPLRHDGPLPALHVPDARDWGQLPRHRGRREGCSQARSLPTCLVHRPACEFLDRLELVVVGPEAVDKHELEQWLRNLG